MRKVLSSANCTIKGKISDALGHGKSHNVLLDAAMCVSARVCESVHNSAAPPRHLTLTCASSDKKVSPGYSMNDICCIYIILFKCVISVSRVDLFPERTLS